MMKASWNNGITTRSCITFLLSVGLLFLSWGASAQRIELKGQVMDTSGKVLPGVNVIEKGTSNGTATDSNGRFTISIPDTESTLIFHFMEFKSAEQKINPQKGYSYELKVTLVEDKLKYRKDKSSAVLSKQAFQ